MPIVMAQDRSPALTKLLAMKLTKSTDLAPSYSPSASLIRRSGPGQRIVIFVADNAATELVVNLVSFMARPGQDVVHLVTVVASSLQQQAGQQLVIKHYKAVAKPGQEVVLDVVVKGYVGLLECFDKYLKDSEANVVSGSSSGRQLPHPPTHC